MIKNKVTEMTVNKAALDLLFYLPVEYFNTARKNTGLPTYKNFLPPQKVTEIEDILHLNKNNRNILPYQIIQSAMNLSSCIKHSDFSNSPKVQEKLQLLNDVIDLYKAKYQKRESKSHSASSPTLENRPTKQLLQELKTARQCDSDKYQELKDILKEREHVLSPGQSKLVRKMSIHAGKKLTLQEAQMLANSLEKKKENK